MRWYIGVLKRYAEFMGRARRKEYWMFVLVNLLVLVGLTTVDTVAGTTNGDYGLLSTLYMLGVLVPAIAVAVRRLHDTGRTGMWLFLGAVPVIGPIVVLVFLALNGERGPNQYGPDPKEPEPAPVVS